MFPGTLRCLIWKEDVRPMPLGVVNGPEDYPFSISSLEDIAAEIIRQYHERVDISDLLSDEDFEGLVL